MLAIRAAFPALLDTAAYSCLSRAATRTPAIHSTLIRAYSSPSKAPDANDPLSENDHVSPNFVNRNPRNLEFMGLGRKRKGWRFQYPPVNYYHKLMFERTARQIRAWVQHSDGTVVISASTSEFAITKHLYSTTDVSAAENIGHVLAQRCREFGITSMYNQVPINMESSPKYSAFLEAIQAGGMELSEREEIVPAYEPGIDYDNEFEYNDLRRRQEMATAESDMKFGTRKSFTLE